MARGRAGTGCCSGAAGHRRPRCWSRPVGRRGCLPATTQRDDGRTAPCAAYFDRAGRGDARRPPGLRSAAGRQLAALLTDRGAARAAAASPPIRGSTSGTPTASATAATVRVALRPAALRRRRPADHRDVRAHPPDGVAAGHAPPARSTLRLTAAGDRADTARRCRPRRTRCCCSRAPLPVRFDTPYLQLDPATRSVRSRRSGRRRCRRPGQRGRPGGETARPARRAARLPEGRCRDRSRCPLPPGSAVPGSAARPRRRCHRRRPLDIAVPPAAAGSWLGGTVTVDGTLPASSTPTTRPRRHRAAPPAGGRARRIAGPIQLHWQDLS